MCIAGSLNRQKRHCTVTYKLQLSSGKQTIKLHLPPKLTCPKFDKFTPENFHVPPCPQDTSINKIPQPPKIRLGKNK